MANARLLLEIAASFANFREDMGKAAHIAESNAKRIDNAFSKLKGQALSLGKSLLAAIGIPLSLGAAFAAFQALKEKVSDAERIVNQLNATLRLTGSSAGFTAEQIEKIGKGIQLKSVFGDDAINSAATALLRFRSIQGNTFREILQLAPDAATVLGVTLPDAAEKLGRAFTDPGRGLRAFKAVGFEISEQQIDLAARMRESGDVAGANAIVFEALRRILAGAGEADTKGLYGTTKKLTRAVEDLEKAYGKKLFGDNRDVVEGLTGLFERLSKRIDESTISLTKLMKPFEALKLSSGILKSALSGFRDSIQAPEAGRSASGKINFAPFDEAEARRNQVTQAAQQQDEQQYVSDQLRIKKRAANAATIFAGELASQKHYLGMRESQYVFAYTQEELATADHYNELRRLAAENSKNEQANIGKQIELKLKAVNAPSTTPEEKEGLTAQIGALANQQEAMRFGLKEKILKIDQEQVVTLKAQRDIYTDIELKLLEISGTARESASASFDFAHRELSKRIVTDSKSSSLSDRSDGQNAGRYLGLLKKRTLQQIDLNQAESNYSTILAKVGNDQARIDLAQQSGVMTTLDAINAKSVAAQKYIDQLAREADAMQSIADTMKEGQVGRDELLTKIAGLRLEIDQLTASADALENTFRGVGVSALTDGLVDVITSTKSVSQSFKDMEKQIIASIGRIASQNISESIFGKTGSLGGVSEWMASLFGGGKAATGKAAAGIASGATGAVTGAMADAAILSLSASATAGSTALTALAASTAASGAASDIALVTLSTTATTGTAALAAMSAAAAAAASALSLVAASSATSGAGSLAGSLFSGLAQGGGLASGTDSARGGLTLVGERGPEIVNIPRGAQVIPNDLLGKFASLFSRSRGRNLEHFASGGISRGGMAIVGERGKEAVYLPRGAQVIPNDVLMAHRESKQTIVNNYHAINVLPGASTKTANQAAAQNALAVQRATRNL